MEAGNVVDRSSRYEQIDVSKALDSFPDNTLHPLKVCHIGWEGDGRPSLAGNLVHDLCQRLR